MSELKPHYSFVRIHDLSQSAFVQDFHRLVHSQFPEKSEIEPLDVILDKFRPEIQTGWLYPFSRLLLVFHTDPLTEERTLAAAAQTELYKKSGFCLMCYLVVHPDHRQRGLARACILEASRLASIDAQERGLSGSLLMVELEDGTEDSEEGLDPRERHLIYQRMGFARIDALEWTLPSLGPDQPPCRHLCLAVYLPNLGEGRNHVLEKAQMLEFIREFFESLTAMLHGEQHPALRDITQLEDYRNAVRQVEAMGPSVVLRRELPW